MFSLTLRAMQHHLRALLYVSGVVTFAATVIAQTSSAWFGVPLPKGIGDPHRPILEVSALKPAAAIVPPGEEGHRDLAGLAIRKDLETIVGFAKADRARGEQAWGRITGFRGADDTHAWVLQQFKAAGLRDSDTQTYTATA